MGSSWPQLRRASGMLQCENLCQAQVDASAHSFALKRSSTYFSGHLAASSKGGIQQLLHAVRAFSVSRRSWGCENTGLIRGGATGGSGTIANLMIISAGCSMLHASHLQCSGWGLLQLPDLEQIRAELSWLAVEQRPGQLGSWSSQVFDL